MIDPRTALKSIIRYIPYPKNLYLRTEIDSLEKAIERLEKLEEKLGHDTNKIKYNI